MQDLDGKFPDFTFYIQNMCIKVLSGVAEKNVIKYQYLNIIKLIVEDEVIENYYEANKLIFVK